MKSSTIHHHRKSHLQAYGQAQRKIKKVFWVEGKNKVFQGLWGVRQKSLCPIFFCMTKTGQLFDNWILIRQTLPLCDCESISVCRGTPWPAERQRAVNTDWKYRAAPDSAMTHKENNGTPVLNDYSIRRLCQTDSWGGTPVVSVRCWPFGDFP